MDLGKHGPASPHFAHFGPCRVDLRSRDLFREGLKFRIQNQSFQLLMVLLEQPGAIVTREDLRQRLWKAQGLVEFDQGLNAALMRLRIVLDDTADTPRFIETLPRQSYRFIAPVIFSNAPSASEGEGLEVAPEGNEGGPTATPAHRPDGPEPHRARLWWKHPGILAVSGLVALALLVIGIASGRLQAMFGRPLAAQAVPTLAVLPFDSLSNDPAHRFQAEAVTEHLITELGKSSALRIISRGSVMQYEGKHLPLEVVAQQLRVDDVLEGSVSESGGHLRVTANLYQVSSRKHLWAETYDRPAGDGISPQREIVLDIARNIQANLTPH
jgi:TolB-like protein/DNA-binding winged helix-turn-helix (wHTH) protein